MTENSNQPKPDDAVLGGQNPPVNAAVLGGIEGVKRQLTSPIVEVRVAALKDALKYGDAGIDLLVNALRDDSNQVQFAAYSLLKDSSETKVKHFFEFDVITVNGLGKENNRRCHFALSFKEDLENGVFLEMVLIPGGTFLMGSPDTEKKRYSNEEPQHQVNVASFFMGKYEVTQAQWKAVAALPQINIALNPDPSKFKGANKPVEQVSWHQALEFCSRLSRKMGESYRLPSEAQWEYACRAGTTAPFYFGKMITTELANYDGNYAYASYPSAPKGIARGRTTDVGSFPPNTFGLYDMLGNLWEWCADPWHENYHGAPSDGKVWESDGDNRYRLRRGGSWFTYPDYCRSAYRHYSDINASSRVIGFRVVCAAAWTS